MDWRSYGAATNVVTLWASSEAVKELLVTATAPSSLNFILFSATRGDVVAFTA